VRIISIEPKAKNPMAALNGATKDFPTRERHYGKIGTAGTRSRNKGKMKKLRVKPKRKGGQTWVPKKVGKIVVFCKKKCRPAIPFTRNGVINWSISVNRCWGVQPLKKKNFWAGRGGTGDPTGR